MANTIFASRGAAATLNAALAADTKGVRDSAQASQAGVSAEDQALRYVTGQLRRGLGMSDYRKVGSAITELQGSLISAEPLAIKGKLDKLAEDAAGKPGMLTCIALRYDLTRNEGQPTMAELLRKLSETHDCAFKLPKNYNIAGKTLIDGDQAKFVKLVLASEGTSATKPAEADKNAAPPSNDKKDATPKGSGTPGTEPGKDKSTQGGAPQGGSPERKAEAEATPAARQGGSPEKKAEAEAKPAAPEGGQPRQDKTDPGVSEAELNQELRIAGRRKLSPREFQPFGIKMKTMDPIEVLSRDLPEQNKVELLTGKDQEYKDKWVENFFTNKKKLPVAYFEEKMREQKEPEDSRNKRVDDLAPKIYGGDTFQQVVLDENGLWKAVERLDRALQLKDTENIKVASDQIRSCLEKFKDKGKDYQARAFFLYNDYQEANKEYGRKPLAESILTAGITDPSLAPPNLISPVPALNRLQLLAAKSEGGEAAAEKEIFNMHGQAILNEFIQLKNDFIKEEKGVKEGRKATGKAPKSGVIQYDLDNLSPEAKEAYAQVIEVWPTPEGISRDMLYQLVGAAPYHPEVKKASDLMCQFLPRLERIYKTMAENNDIIKNSGSPDPARQGEIAQIADELFALIRENPDYMRAVIRMLNESGNPAGLNAFNFLCTIDPELQKIAAR